MKRGQFLGKAALLSAGVLAGLLAACTPETTENDPRIDSLITTPPTPVDMSILKPQPAGSVSGGSSGSSTPTPEPAPASAPGSRPTTAPSTSPSTGPATTGPSASINATTGELRLANGIKIAPPNSK